jgi:hypothetical protein
VNEYQLALKDSRMGSGFVVCDRPAVLRSEYFALFQTDSAPRNLPGMAAARSAADVESIDRFGIMPARASATRIDLLRSHKVETHVVHSHELLVI